MPHRDEHLTGIGCRVNLNPCPVEVAPYLAQYTGCTVNSHGDDLNKPHTRISTALLSSEKLSIFRWSSLTYLSTSLTICHLKLMEILSLEASIVLSVP